ncbi:Uncharacterized protein Adt_39048 [Abeliophyllum distichum]|uniref:Transposase-associated domain-containing protein n=1 Tax=Abeliophyllum distichum TaxID=126358 RepID=A0ABD1Q3Y6_9LAMI
MARPYVNNKRMIKCLCTRCLNCLKYLLKTVEAHIFRHGFAQSYVTWIYNGKTEVQTLNVYTQNERADVHDEMMDVMNDVVSDEHVGTCTDSYYDELFEALH